MKNKDKLQNESGEQGELHAVPHTSVRVSLFAAVVCILLAVVVWLGVMCTEDTDYLALEVLEPAAGYTYQLSVNAVQVSGKVSALKSASVIGVKLPSSEPGEYYLTAKDLVLPEGVQLTAELYLILTVTAG